jgi:Neprosin
VFETLGDHADLVGFYGEIFDSDEVAGRTKTDMTSGYFPDAGWQYSGYLHNLRVQTDRARTMDDYNGSPSVTDPEMYDLELHLRSGGSWGSYFWVGGPGAG